jgi:hypothetical protein
MKVQIQIVITLFLTLITQATYPLLVGAGLNGNCDTRGTSFDSDGGSGSSTRFLIGGRT